MQINSYIMNKLFKTSVLFVMFACISFSMLGRENIGEVAPPRGVVENEGFRNDCNPSNSQVDLDINNVRARLLAGGDLWWDLSDGRYVIPNVAPGEKEVSSIFAAALWIGGYDSGLNLKIAAQTYRQGGNDFWTGPLDASGNTNNATCTQWDEHFIVLGEDIEAHIADFVEDGVINGEIPDGVKFWPARGNREFPTKNGGFDLPDQDLAPFFDVQGNGTYDPDEGDFPIIGVGDPSSSIDDQAYADQMIWWVYNDKGNIHSETNGDQIGLEVQALAFSYRTNDEINNMSFYKYVLLNKATTSIFDTYMGQWVDPDLGCWDNDYIGCDTTRALGIVYNGEATDPDCSDGGSGTVNGYGNTVPLLGVDYFQGPTDENGNELGLSAFVYYNNDFTVQGNPEVATDYYGYLSGFWKDGSPIEWGGDGYNEGTFSTPYMFPSDPSDSSPDAWSECAEGTAPADRRFVQSSGPFRLDPGATNEVIVGAVWVPEGNYPCPSFTRLQQADDKAQGLFDNNFKLTDGPDAPDITVVELDREIILTLTNDSLNSNNYLEGYSEKAPNIPTGFVDSTYRFQGYLVYQTTSPNDVTDFDDIDNVRLIAQVDVRDGVTKLFNYLPPEDADINILIPTVEIIGNDKGIEHSFHITEDLFATGDPKLVNHKKYYFTAISYAYNNYLPYDPLFPAGGGQQIQYLEGRKNIKTYTAIPHINTPEGDGTTVNASYGDEPEITRVDGLGNSGDFLELTETTTANILAENNPGRITYQSQSGPFTVRVTNPLEIRAGTYELVLEDGDLTDVFLRDPVTWVLTDASGTQWFSDKPLDNPNEQIIPDAGFSVTMELTEDVGDTPTDPNGFIGASVSYGDPNGVQWYGGLPDQAVGPFTNFIRTGPFEEEEARDPDQVYSGILGGTWYPYPLVSWKAEPNVPNGGFITPAWTNTFSTQVDARNKMETLNNVDIVFTSDKTKWSRCVVVNTFSDYYAGEGLPNPDSAPFELRSDVSLDKDGNPDSDPTNTGFSWFPGYAIDVETGERLNIFFGENTYFNPESTVPGSAVSLGLSTMNGKDMLFNPSSAVVDFIDPSIGFQGSLAEIPIGGQHFIYVTKELYDGCAQLGVELAGSAFSKVTGWSKVSWTSIPFLPTGVQMNSVADGLIPNDLTVKLRVNNPFEVYTATGENNGYPKYEFSFDGFEAEVGNTEVATNALDLINVVPNPYYAFSAYEAKQNEGIVKFTNLPPQCKISIFSLDGRLVRTYNRNETLSNRLETQSGQIDTFLDWDLRNSKGIQISSGVYVIHINAEGLGERVIKWFGSIRQFDSSGL